jgi:hypothetical protein
MDADADADSDSDASVELLVLEIPDSEDGGEEEDPVVRVLSSVQEKHWVVVDATSDESDGDGDNESDNESDRDNESDNDNETESNDGSESRFEDTDGVHTTAKTPSSLPPLSPLTVVHESQTTPVDQPSSSLGPTQTPSSPVVQPVIQPVIVRPSKRPLALHSRTIPRPGPRTGLSKRARINPLHPNLRK